MRIHAPDIEADLKLVEIELTRAEAGEFVDTLRALLAASTENRHEHISSADFQTEVTVSLAPDGAPPAT